jgi:autotransporter translocation and assembly factor TamB
LTDDAPETPTERAERKTILPRVIVAVCLGLLVVIAAMLATMRYGVLLPQARLLIEARAEGLKIGRMGKLHIEGLEGDVWRDLKIRRLTITDEKGVWLEARNLRLAWRYAELLRRRFDAELVSAENIRLVRRPTLTPKGSPGLELNAQAADLSKVAGGPAHGPANLAGRLYGDAKAWRLTGTVTATRAEMGGYSLARISGPVELAQKGKAFELTGTLQGAGGPGLWRSPARPRARAR